MSYLEFLAQWYNLLYLALAGAGTALLLFRHRGDRDLLFPGAAFVAVGAVGLTLNGAVHDLGLGSPADYLALVLGVSAATGTAVGWGVRKLRDRWFPPVTGMRWNPTQEEGSEAQVVTSEVTGEPGSGRAQWQDADGHLVIVRCHTDGEPLRFGKQVRLVEYYAEGDSYLVVPR